VKASKVYFFATRDRVLVKIGATERPIEMRHYEIQRAYPTLGALEVLVAVPGDFRLERYLHKRFQHLRVWGEVFRCTDEVTSWILRARQDLQFLEAERDQAASSWIVEPLQIANEREARRARQAEIKTKAHVTYILREGSVESKCVGGFTHLELLRVLNKGTETLAYGLALAAAVMADQERWISRVAHVVFYTGETFQDRLYLAPGRWHVNYQKAREWKL